MALEPASGVYSASPESSGRDSPVPRGWRNQLGQDEPPVRDKAYRKYVANVEKVLSQFETTLEEWADYISFLNRLLKSLQARPTSAAAIPAKAIVAKRLSQCLNPALPSGVHQKALEVYNYVFSVIGKDGLSQNIPLYLPGLAPTLSFASLSVRAPFLDILENHVLGADPRSLRPATKSIILALLPGLEDETSEDFDRTLNLVTSFKKAIRPPDSQPIDQHHSSGDAFFWQCFFLASITGHGRRSGALAYLNQSLPVLAPVPSIGPAVATTQDDVDEGSKMALIVTSPEPGLLVRCFASGLTDDQLLIQRGFLDLLVSHLPLNSAVLQSRVKPADLKLLVEAAAGVVTRRDMSLNRRLWAWLLGPEPVANEADSVGDPATPSREQHQASLSPRTSYFEEFGLQPLTKALLDMIRGAASGTAAERARPYRMCLSLMDKWEIGGLVVPEVFLPVVESVRQYQSRAPAKADFAEVLRSASVFFDGIESGLIFSEIFRLLAQALGVEGINMDDRVDKISLVGFIVANFNVREEEMVTIHGPLTCLAALSMLEHLQARAVRTGLTASQLVKLSEKALNVIVSLVELVPDRAFPAVRAEAASPPSDSNADILKRVKTFYLDEHGNLDSSQPPFDPVQCGELLLQKAVKYTCDDNGEDNNSGSYEDLGLRVRIFTLMLLKTPTSYKFDVDRTMAHLQAQLQQTCPLPFSHLSSVLHLATQLYSADRIDATQLSEMVSPLVCHAWSYLAASDPKYHVETVRCLWQLQTALTPWDREIEAALSGILVESQSTGPCVGTFAEAARTFGVLWSHTLQDTAGDRRGPRTPMQEYRPTLRLSGMEHYPVMLTQPLFLVLDALLDERTQAYMVVKSWLNNAIGMDRLFLLFVDKLHEMPFLSSVGIAVSDGNKEPVLFNQDDDLDLWSAEEGEMTLQDYFIRACAECVTGEIAADADEVLAGQVSQLRRYALIILHQFLSSRHAPPVAQHQLDKVFLDRLAKSISTPDPYVQVLLLDVILDTLKLQDTAQGERPATATSERMSSMTDRARGGRTSVSVSENSHSGPQMPPQLLKCLQAGLSCPSSHSVLDSWISFLGDCLPFFSHSIFQVLIPLVETLCRQIGTTLSDLRNTFLAEPQPTGGGGSAPESALFYLLNGLERVLALAHDQLLTQETRARLLKGPEQTQSLLGSMVSGVFQSENAHSRSATANDRLTVHLAFQDTMRTCYKIWSWGQGDEAKKQDPASLASFNYTSLRMRNRARRLLEHLFAAETLECLETVIGIWRSAAASAAERAQVFHFLSALDACRPRHCVPALFNSIYSRTNPSALDPSRKSAMTISLQDLDLVVFLVEYARSLEDDAMDEIWADCMTFLRDLLGNPFPHRQTLPSLLEFAGILGEKVDNTNFGEQRRMRRELSDIFLRLLAALFTTRPMTFADANGSTEKLSNSNRRRTMSSSGDGSEDVVRVLASIVPKLPQILLENDRVVSAAATISTNVIGPALRSRGFPDTFSPSVIRLLLELSRLHNGQKAWKKDVAEAFNDGRFLGTKAQVVEDEWLPLLRQWVLADKERMGEIVGRISAPTTAGIVFGVGATSARLEADRRTQLNLRRMATLVLASADDAFVADLTVVMDKLVELLAATATSSPSSTTRADVFQVVRALVLKTKPVHLAALWPVINGEMHAAMSSVAAAENSVAAETYGPTAILQACKLLDLLVCVAPDDFQLHEWLFVTDTIDAVYRPATYQPVALVDELADELGGGGETEAASTSADPLAGERRRRRPLLGETNVVAEGKEDLVTRVLRPFFGQLSIFAFESTYAMGVVDREACVRGLLRDVFDERTVSLLLWQVAFAVDDHAGDNDGRPHRGDDNPLMFQVLDGSVRPLYVVLYGQQFAPSRMRSLGRLWSGIFDWDIWSRDRDGARYLLTEQPLINPRRNEQSGAWVYVVTSSPNLGLLNRNPTEGYEGGRFLPFGGVPWSQVRSYAYLPAGWVGLLPHEWLVPWLGNNDWAMHPDNIAEHMVENAQYDERWDRFGLATVNIAIADRADRRNYLRHGRNQRRLIDSLTTHGNLVRESDPEIEGEEPRMESIPEDEVAVLRNLFHWDPTNTSRSFPLGEPGQPESLRSRSLRSLSLDNLDLEPPALRTRLASGIAQGFHCEEVFREINAEEERRKRRNRCTLLRKRQDQPQQHDRCDDLVQLMEKCPILLDKIDGGGRHNDTETKSVSKPKPTKAKKPKAKKPKAKKPKSRSKKTSKSKQPSRADGNKIQRPAVKPASHHNSTTPKPTAKKQRPPHVNGTRVQVEAESQCKGGHDYKGVLKGMTTAELDELDVVLQRNHPSEFRTVALFALCGPLFVINSKPKLAKRHASLLSTEERAMCIKVKNKACVKDEKKQKQQQPLKYIFYASHEWPSVVEQMGGFLPEGTDRHQFFLGDNNAFLDFGEAAERAAAHPPKDESMPEQAGVVYYVHATPNMLIPDDGRNITIVGGIVWSQVRGWLQIKAGYRRSPPHQEASDKTAALHGVHKAAQANLTILTPNKKYDVRFDSLTATPDVMPTTLRFIRSSASLLREEATRFMDEKGKPVGWKGDFPLFKKGRVAKARVKPPHHEGFWRSLWDLIEKHPYVDVLITVGVGALGFLVMGPAGAVVAVEAVDEAIPLLAIGAASA
ncbi:hypothetical protein L249_3612 [Ophiocordyceps polyrhachis-furcata BCC 54312]|uniref:Uncharacterized protein n=1 Tax=Ophiocordyceps polyrhachis-furcata BCC 54312 TaxID=1330021 RepID=A0A367LMB3_9HYPO|nr:hypothetical protein L249_3612 [Ophiocordyceps polyrhachis-furcata BCC 54312]